MPVAADCFFCFSFNFLDELTVLLDRMGICVVEETWLSRSGSVRNPGDLGLISIVTYII